MTILGHGHGVDHAYECDGSERRECPCGLQVAYDPENGFQHLDGSISHDGKYWDKSVSDLMKTASGQVYYHGTNVPGMTHILPAAQHGKGVSYPGETDRNYAYATPNLGHAWEYAGEAHGNSKADNPGRPRVYEVHPIDGDHHVEEDPDWDPVHQTDRGVRDEDKRSPVGFKVVRELDAPDRVKQWYHERDKDNWIGKEGVQRQAKRWMPNRRIFGPTHGLDHRLFDGEKLRPDVREYILNTLNSFWRPMFSPGWKTWAKVYFAGSEASEWTSQALEGNNDFDILIGVDYDKFRASVGGMSGKSDEEITSALNESFREGLNPRTDAATIFIDGQATGPWDNTWYVNKNSYDIREIRPYAAYDVTADEWVVKPPHLPEWNTKAFPEGKGLEQEIRGIIDMAKGILAMPEPYRTQSGRALWEFVHSNRSDAFGPQGEGWYDSRNVVEKALDQAGLMQKLWTLMDRARQDPHVLDSPAGWSNNPSK